MQYLIVHPSTPLKTRGWIEKIWSRNLIYLPVVLTLMQWGLGSWILFQGELITASAVGASGTVTATVPGWFFGRFLRNKQLTYRPATAGSSLHQSEWSNMLTSIFEIEDELYEYVRTMSTDSMAYSSAFQAWRNVSEVQWQAVQQYQRMTPYLRSPRATTKDILQDELKVLALHRDKAQLISDQVLHIGLRSESFLHNHDAEHLEVSIRELDAMVQTMDELHEASAFQLGPAKEDSEMEKRVKANYLQAESHKVRGA